MPQSQYQTEMLDQYLDALLRDPDALPPADLEPDMALIAQALIDGKADGHADDRVKDRVWSRVLFATYAPPELEPSYSISALQSPPDSKPVQCAAVLPRQKPQKQRVDVAFLIAAMFAVACLTGMFIQYTEPARLDLFQHNPRATQQIDLRPPLPRDHFQPAMLDLELLPPGSHDTRAEYAGTTSPDTASHDTASLENPSQETASLTLYTAAHFPE